MELANQASQLSLRLAANLAITEHHALFRIWSFLALKNKMATAKMQMRGLKLQTTWMRYPLFSQSMVEICGIEKFSFSHTSTFYQFK